VKKNPPLFLFLTFSSSLVSAVTCESQQIINFADGGLIGNFYFSVKK